MLDGALRLGGPLGGVAALGLLARLRVGADLRLGPLLWGLPITAGGVWPDARDSHGVEPKSQFLRLLERHRLALGEEGGKPLGAKPVA